jgi:DNA-binding LytR/AlgR family response regulator
MIVLRLAICDDTPLYAGELAAQLYEIAEELSLEITVDTYRSYSALGEAHAADPYEVIFLEIALSDGDGIEFAEQLRSEDIATDLVFYSSTAARAHEAYGVFPTGYLLKPPQKRRVRHVLEFIRARRGLARTLLLRTPGGGRAAIPLDAIRYVEVLGNELSVHTDRETVRCIGALTDAFRGVSPRQFYRCHRSFLVNMRAVRSLHRYCFLMENGEEVAVAKNRYAQAKEILNEFLIFEHKNE